VVEQHFTPRYRPWDQRLCIAPDGDLFSAIGAGTVTVVTDQIDHFLSHGIRLASGRTLPADVIVSATGLVLRPAGGIALQVDSRRIDLGEMITYRGMMLEGVPKPHLHAWICELIVDAPVRHDRSLGVPIPAVSSTARIRKWNAVREISQAGQRVVAA